MFQEPKSGRRYNLVSFLKKMHYHMGNQINHQKTKNFRKDVAPLCIYTILKGIYELHWAYPRQPIKSTNHTVLMIHVIIITTTYLLPPPSINHRLYDHSRFSFSYILYTSFFFLVLRHWSVVSTSPAFVSMDGSKETSTSSVINSRNLLG